MITFKDTASGAVIGKQAFPLDDPLLEPGHVLAMAAVGESAASHWRVLAPPDASGAVLVERVEVAAPPAAEEAAQAA